MSPRLRGKPNAPYLSIDVLGRFGFAAYRVAESRWNVVLVRQREDEDDPTSRIVGLFVGFGPVGTFLRWRA